MKTSFVFLLALLAIFTINIDKFVTEKKSMPNSTGYWIWAGIPPNAAPENATWYIYQGVVTQKNGAIKFSKKGLYPFPIKHKSLYLVLRVDGELPNAGDLSALALSLINAWKVHDVTVQGIQLDFDAATSKLLQYSEFLAQFRQALAQNYKLSITGLGDWVLNADQAVLQHITYLTDEVIFQLYQGRQPLTNMERYIDKLSAISIPFKVGLLERYPNQIFLNRLKSNSHFSGVVFFIQR